MAPSEVKEANEDVVRARLYPLKPKSFNWKYDIGDRVRIAMQRQPFRKGYLGQWSEELFENKCKKLQFIHTVNGVGSKTAKIIKRQC